MSRSIQMVLIWSFIIGGCMALGYAYKDGMSIWHVVKQQEHSTGKMKLWMRAYAGLKPVGARWEKTFSPRDEVVDFLSVAKPLALESDGLTTNTDKLSIEATGKKGWGKEAKLGLVPVCVGSNGGGLRVHADDIDALFSGLEAFASRKDTRIGRVTFSSHDPKTLVIFNACLLMRSGGNNG